ncbi:MAG: hypothetical protein Q6373_007380 [Candidatus Sigynarchaeota archaeon]
MHDQFLTLWRLVWAPGEIRPDFLAPGNITRAKHASIAEIAGLSNEIDWIQPKDVFGWIFTMRRRRSIGY